MKFIQLVILGICMFLSTYATGQHDHHQCRITMEQCDSIMLAQGYNIAETNPASESRNNTVIRPRPFEVLLVYDTRIQDMTGLDNQEITDIILESAQDVPDGIDNAQGDNPGFNFTVSDFTADYVEGVPVTTIHTYLLLTGDGKLDSITNQRNVYDYDAIFFIVAPGSPGSAAGAGSQMSINPGPFALFKAVCSGKWEGIESGIVVIGHELGHIFGMDHEIGANSPASPLYARAKVLQNKATIMKASSSLSLQNTAVYSGPNSIIDGDTLGSVDECNICVFDTIKSLYWIDNPRTYIDSIWGYTCGTGSLDVESNADSLHWTVLAGEPGLSDSSGNHITYTCNTPSIVELRATRTGRGYSKRDTVYLSPDPVTMVYDTLTSGETHTLPDGKIVDIGGVYTTKLTGQWGCDSTIVTHLAFVTGIWEVENSSTLKFFPNPSSGTITLDASFPWQQVRDLRIYNAVGQEIFQSHHLQSRQIQHPSPGGLLILLMRMEDGRVYTGKEQSIVSGR